MAIAIRLALLSYHNISLLLRKTSHLHARHISYSASSPHLRYSVPHHTVPISPTINFLLESRRCFAKGRKLEDDYDDAGNMVKIVNIGPTVKAAAVSHMEAAVEALSRDLSKLRTGRASAGMLDHIIVETGGLKMPLNWMAVVSVLDSKTLSVTPHNPNALKELESAIVSSPLGINPKADGQRLIAAIPPLTKDHVLAVCKVVAKSSEDVKQSIRRARQKALDTIKKALPKKEKEKGGRKKDKEKEVSGFSGDDAKRLEKEIDELTKKFIKSAEDMCKAKENEINGG